MDKKSKKTLPAAVSIAAVLLLAFLDLLCGGADVPAGEVIRGLSGHGQYAPIILSIRLPRVLTAVLSGACLALAGAQMQAIFRNPLADPHIMGVSGGAGLGAAIMTLGISGGGILSGLPIAAAAFCGAALASVLIILVSKWFHSGPTLLIFGVMLGFVFSALTSILQYTAGEESLKLFYSWAAGSFSSCGKEGLAVMAIALGAGTILAAGNTKGLDIILFGENFASLSGASPRAIRFRALLGCCIMTGAVTAFCGPIGFAGIVAPHIARKIWSTSVHRTILPASIACGSCLTLLADMASFTFKVPLPAGSTVAVIGIPLILLILLDRND